ncbi:MAG: HAMP domain-containing sensor histidine kinase [Saprospiraceae bacterium]
MKLLRQTQRLFFRTALPVFALAGVILFFTLRWLFDHETDDKLLGTRAEIESYVRTHDTLPDYFQTVYDRWHAIPVMSDQVVPSVKFTDTAFYNRFENETEPFRQLRFPVKARDRAWMVYISTSKVEYDDLVLILAVMLAAVFVLLLLVMLWVNRVVSRRVWRPFFETLEKLRRFRLSDRAPLSLAPSSVDEIQELNHTLEQLAHQVRRDYSTVKKFTENASHELQTPLAVIQGKVDMLMQDGSLSESQVQQIDVIGQGARRMSRLNQSMLLLSKIENHQFVERETVDLKSLLNKKLVWLEDFIAEKELDLQIDLAEKTLDINPFLAETLVTNLLTNAIRHNLAGGLLRITLKENYLKMENSANPPGDSIAHLTGRFARGNPHSEGVGLGLSMVLEICEQYGFKPELAFDDKIWTVQVFF